MFIVCYIQIRLRQERDFRKSYDQFVVLYNITGKPSHMGESTVLRPVAKKVVSGNPTVKLQVNSFEINSPLLLFIQYEINGSPLSYHTFKVVDGTDALSSKTILLNDAGRGFDTSSLFLREKNRITFTHHYQGKLVESDALPTTAFLSAQFVSLATQIESTIDSDWLPL